MNYKKTNNMIKSFVVGFLLIISYSTYGQEFITDANFADKINEQHAFGNDKQNIVVVEFWANFNKDNAFEHWAKVKGVKYYRIDVATSPEMKKKYRIRMAPTVIIFNKGIEEEKFKAGLDLLVPMTLKELQESIEEVKTADSF